MKFSEIYNRPITVHVVGFRAHGTVEFIIISDLMHIFLNEVAHLVFIIHHIIMITLTIDETNIFADSTVDLTFKSRFVVEY